MKDTLLNRLQPVYFFLLILFPLLVFLTFNKHKSDYIYTYHSVLWADAAGYYVYLPYWFIYGNNIESYPDSITVKTGDGFHFDTGKKQVLTKYTCGTALLQTPFFLLAHALAAYLGFSPDGFSKPYLWAIFIASAFYCSLGLYFLFKVLKKYFGFFISLVTVFTILLATNLYYYTVDNGGMSHVYSFFLVSLFIYAYDSFYDSINLSRWFFISVIAGFIILVRPVNIFVLLVFLFYRSDVYRLRLNVWMLLVPVIVLLVLFIPQMMYWYSISGQWIFYSYQNESFVFWNKPQLIKLWFSTNNGLFTYAPVLILSVAGSIKMLVDKVAGRFLFPVVFVLVSYTFASWHSWHLGCAYGARGFIEYLPLFALPLAYLLRSIRTKTIKFILAAFIIACIAANFDMTYYYSSCFTYGDWNWKSYFDLFKN